MRDCKHPLLKLLLYYKSTIIKGEWCKLKKCESRRIFWILVGFYHFLIHISSWHFFFWFVWSKTLDAGRVYHFTSPFLNTTYHTSIPLNVKGVTEIAERGAGRGGFIFPTGGTVFWNRILNTRPASSNAIHLVLSVNLRLPRMYVAPVLRRAL